MRDPDTGMAALCGNQTFNGVIVNDLPWSRTVVAVWQIGWSLDAPAARDRWFNQWLSSWDPETANLFGSKMPSIWPLSGLNRAP